jgi:serine/threonine protein kinase
MADETEADDATLELRSDLFVGSRVADRYDVQALLGVGGMGSVYRVWDRAVDQVVALKLLGGTAGPEDSEAPRREVRLARRVTHRNIARIHDLGEHGERRYLTMEYVEGSNLRDWLRERGRPEMPVLLDIGSQIAAGLTAAHAAGVVHRDLKPANILIETGGRVVIADFGIAYARESMQPHALVGTPAYMAPEQVLGGEIGAATDLYALGLILFELATGELPYVGATPLAIALARLEQQPAMHAVPELLVPLLEELLAREPERRLRHAGQLVERLRALAERRDDTEPSLGRDDTEPSLGESLAPRARTIAVLPFRHRGPAEQHYVSEALGDELIDVLTTMRGLRVSASGATARFIDSASQRDPRAVGQELGVELVVDATATLAGPQIRIAARLLEVVSGTQLWSERYDGTLTDVFELQDKLGKRIGEALRLEVEHLTHRQSASDAAIDLYLRARCLARDDTEAGLEQAIEQFERCLALAPGFRLALAGYAVTSVRRWFQSDMSDPNRAAAAKQAVDVARQQASSLAETHLAVAMYAVQLGEFREAGSALHQALQIAPTYAAAHDYLGRLQLEAGRPQRGLRHAELAFELNPSLFVGLLDLARYHALRGDRERFHHWWNKLLEICPHRHMARLQEVRIAVWFNDDEWRVRALARVSNTSDPRFRGMVISGFENAALSEPEVRQTFEAGFANAGNPRFRAMISQFACEAAAWRGYDQLAMRCLNAAVDNVLVDLDWLEHCPLLERLRDLDEYAHARMVVAERADAIWAS